MAAARGRRTVEPPPGDGSVPPAVRRAAARRRAERARADARAAARCGPGHRRSVRSGLAAEVGELDEPRRCARSTSCSPGPGAAGRRAAALRLPPPGGPPRGLCGRAGGLASRRSRPCGAALERRGAGPVERAHHVEHAADRGDEQAIALLERRRRASCSRPRRRRRRATTPPRCGCSPTRSEARTSVQARLAEAQAAAGDASGARETLLDALRYRRRPRTGCA